MSVPMRVVPGSWTRIELIPPLCSRTCSRRVCVVFPHPSPPSNTMNFPRKLLIGRASIRMKSETRNPKPETNPDDECRKTPTPKPQTQLRVQSFGLRGLSYDQKLWMTTRQ